MTKGWQRRANRDLWGELDVAVSQRKVRWEWVDQSARNPFHKEAHARATNLATQAEKLQPAPAEKGKGVPEVQVARRLTHVDELGRPRMVDVSQKPDTQRQAVAKCVVRMQASTFDLIKKKEIAKGDVLAVAQLAGVMAAKQTPHIIPLCHPVLIGDVNIEFSLDEDNSAVEITTTVKSVGKTGVEMEALTATAVAALTIYDMCKAVDPGIQMESIRLIRKSGGKSGAVNLE